LLIGALQDAHVSATDLALNEAHGTGTALGDPIEAGSLVGSILVARDTPLAVGGVKANMGHAEPAAGMTGLLKLALGLQKGEVAPNAHLRVLNPHVDGCVKGMPCVLPVVRGALPEGVMYGGVSSFGYTGTIAHTVLSFGLSTSTREDTYSSAFAAGGGFGDEFDSGYIYKRRAFLWRPKPPPVTPEDLATAGLYQAVWTSLPPNEKRSTSNKSNALVVWQSSAAVPACVPSSQSELHTLVFVVRDAQYVAPSLNGAAATLHLAQVAQSGMRSAKTQPKMLVVTSGAVTADPKAQQPRASGVAHGGVWGFMRCARLEVPSIRMMTRDCGSWDNAKLENSP
jgi:acyl transferase domain-containing protein